MNDLRPLKEIMVMFNKMYGEYKKDDFFHDEERMKVWSKEVETLIGLLTHFKVGVDIKFYDLQLEREQAILDAKIKSDTEKSLERIKELEGMIERQQKDAENNGY